MLEVAEEHLILRQDDSTTTNSKNEHEVTDRMQDVVSFARAQNQESTVQEVLEVADEHLILQDDSTTTNSKNEHEVADRM